MDSKPVNQHRGRVVNCSKNRAEITVRLNNGGGVICENRGFKIGDEVCLMFDALNQKVIDIMPAQVADILIQAGQDEVLSHVVGTPPEETENSEFNDDILQTLANINPEEVLDDDPTSEDDEPSVGQDHESSLDQCLRDYGINDEEWHSEPGDGGEG